jgi:hypothetical protein
LVTLLLALCVIGATPALAAPQTYEAQRHSYDEWMATLQPCLFAFEVNVVPWGVQIPKHRPFDWEHGSIFTFRSVSQGPGAELRDIPGGEALKNAALYYTLSSGDLEATPEELQASGWWPFASIPVEQAAMPVLQGEAGGEIFSKESLLTGIGEPQWVLHAKSQILRRFYEEFFFGARSGLRELAELPVSCPEFWINPFTGDPCQRSDTPGDLKLLDANYFADNLRSRGYPVGETRPEIPTFEELKESPRPVMVFVP